MVPPPRQGRSGERGGLVPPHGRTKYKLSWLIKTSRVATCRHGIFAEKCEMLCFALLSHTRLTLYP